MRYAARDKRERRMLAIIRRASNSRLLALLMPSPRPGAAALNGAMPFLCRVGEPLIAAGRVQQQVPDHADLPGRGGRGQMHLDHHAAERGRAFFRAEQPASVRQGAFGLHGNPQGCLLLAMRAGGLRIVYPPARQSDDACLALYESSG